MSLYNVIFYSFILTKELSLCSAAYIWCIAIWRFTVFLLQLSLISFGWQRLQHQFRKTQAQHRWDMMHETHRLVWIRVRGYFCTVNYYSKISLFSTECHLTLLLSMIIISTITWLCVFADEQPDIRISHDSENGEFRILCEIPGSDNGGYTCFLSLGDEYPQFKKIQSHELSGKTLCRFTVLEYEFSYNLKSVENKVVSCSYSPKNSPSIRSYSDKFNLTSLYC